MPQLAIYAKTKEFDEEVIGYTQDITLTDTETYSILELNGAVLNKSITFEVGDQIFFLLDPYRCFYLYYYTLAENITLDPYNCNTTAIKIELDSKPYYSRFYYTLIKSWYAESKKYQWRELNTLSKKVWIDACRAWTYSNKKNYILNQQNKTIIFDGKQIKSELDLYCYLGELFIGYRGYMGSNLDAIEDVMIDLRNKEHYSIVLKNLDQMLNNLSTEKNILKRFTPLYFLENIVDIFEKAHFKEVSIL